MPYDFTEYLNIRFVLSVRNKTRGTFHSVRHVEVRRNCENPNTLWCRSGKATVSPFKAASREARRNKRAPAVGKLWMESCFFFIQDDSTKTGRKIRFAASGFRNFPSLPPSPYPPHLPSQSHWTMKERPINICLPHLVLAPHGPSADMELPSISSLLGAFVKSSQSAPKYRHK